jgi:hypothetical protein
MSDLQSLAVFFSLAYIVNLTRFFRRHPQDE